MREFPDSPENRRVVAVCLNNLAIIQSEGGQVEAAQVSHQRAAAIRADLTRDYPTFTVYRSDLATSLANLGSVQNRLGRPAEALESFRQATAILEKLPSPGATDHYNLACVYSLCSSVVGADPSNLSDSERSDRRWYADRAVVELRRAIALGYRELAWIRRDVDLDPLRSRDDFQSLLLDLAFPADSFAH